MLGETMVCAWTILSALSGNAIVNNDAKSLFSWFEFAICQGRFSDTAVFI